MILAALAYTPEGAADDDIPAITQTTSRQQLSTMLQKEFSLSPHIIKIALGKAEFRPNIIERMLKPYEAKPYAEYRPLFVNTRLAKTGRDYIRRHRDIFDQAQKKYGVQAEIITAILGMETRFGHFMGKDRILDALYTLSTGYPKRSKFFRKELGHFLLMCEEEGLQPETLKGSMAGAFGTAQFMPSSFRAYAVDGDKDGKRNIWNDPADIIFSVANYFHRHGWSDVMPVAHWLPSTAKSPRLQQALQKGTHKWEKLSALKGTGIGMLSEMWKDNDRVTLLSFDTREGKKTALVHYNFYVIMRYNTAQNYAMAATELADLLGCKMCASK